jgi:hypothetical protein
VFSNPIKAENLKDDESYDACPYCLTELTMEKEVEIEDEQKPESTEARSGQISEVLVKNKPAEPHARVQGCAHHFGYLSTRAAKEKIPEECMVCESIVQCMLKTITG